MKHIILVLGLLLACLAHPAFAALNVLSCESEWASLAQELGGSRVKAQSATTPFQDVHYIQARPSLLAKARRADLLICSGAQLEIGWLPVLLRQSGNRAIQPGQRGYLEAARYVQMLEVPATVDRSAGDIHPSGNPHIQTDPHNIAAVAKELSARLSALDPQGKAEYAARYADFSKRWSAALTRWEQQAAPLAGMHVVAHHKDWVYMLHWLGIVEVVTLEPKPGVPPSASDLARLLDTLSRQPAEAIIRTAYQDERPSKWLANRTGLPAVILPHTVGAVEGADDLFGLFDTMVARLLAASGQNSHKGGTQ